MCGFFPYQVILQFRVDPDSLSYNLTQFWHELPSLMQTPQAGGSAPWDHSATSQPPLEMLVATPSCHLHFWPSGCTSWVLTMPSSGWIICYSDSQNSGKTHLLINYKRYNKSCMWTARWRSTQVKVSGRGITIPCPLQVYRPPSTSVCSPTQKLSNPIFRVLWRSYYLGTIDYIIDYWWWVHPPTSFPP